MTLLTTREMAKIIGTTPRNLLAIAHTRGVKPAKTIGCNSMCETGQAKLLKRAPRGRPWHARTTPDA